MISVVYRSALEIQLFDLATYARTAGNRFEKPKFQVASVYANLVFVVPRRTHALRPYQCVFYLVIINVF